MLKILKYGFSILAGVFLLLAIYSMLQPEGPGELGGTLKFGAIVVTLGLSIFFAALTLLIIFWRRKIFRYILLLVILGPILYFAAARGLNYFEQHSAEHMQATQAERSDIIAELYIDQLATLGTDIAAFEKLRRDFDQHLTSENISTYTGQNTDYFGWTRNMYIVTFVDPDYHLEILYFTKPEYCTAFKIKFADQLPTALTPEFLNTDCGAY